MIKTSKRHTRIQGLRNEQNKKRDNDETYCVPNRVWHDRSWWVANYPNIAFVLGGWWYWNAGYWYPAWGYDPYGWYSYDRPIYTGYVHRAPDRMIENVQVALQRQGYYAGSIDGVLGLQTRGALAAFQSDNGLAVTSAVDKPTLQALELA